MVEEEGKGEAGQREDQRRLHSRTQRDGYFSRVRGVLSPASPPSFSSSALGINRTAEVTVGIGGISSTGLVGLGVTCGDHPIHVEFGSLQGLLPFKPNKA
jgi:hypothetical protein